MNNINLISGKNYDFEKQNKVVKSLKISAVVSLIIVAAVAIFFFIITVFNPISTVKKDQQDTIQGIFHLHDKLVTQTLIADRVKYIKQIMTSRKDYPFITKTILDKLPGDLSVTSLQLETSILSITVEGSSLTSINQYIDDFLLASIVSKKISGISIQSLVYNVDSSTYALTFKATIN